MTLGARAKGSLAAVVLPLAMAMAVPVAAEPAPGAPVGASSPPGGEAAGRATAGASALEAARLQARYRRGRSGPEARLRGLVQQLKLDPVQEAKVRRILLVQREALRRAMSAPGEPGVPRVAAIHAITSRTAERIRAVLNEDQRKLYSKPLPADYSSSEGKPGLEEWMNALHSKGSQGAP
jgi:hypothetical protein